MKTIAPVVVLALLAGCAATSAEMKTIPFDVHGGYFVSNQFEPKAPRSFVVARDQKAFEGVFGVAMVMGDKSHRLPADAFEKGMVVAAIHRGGTLWKYKVESVRAEGKTLVVRYSTTTSGGGTAQFTCPMIVSVPKGDFTAVEFVEDGKTVKKVEAGAGR